MPLPEHVVRLQRQLARDEVYSSLRRWIIDGVLKPGETMRDKELAARLGVSRTPIREALLRLEDDGLVETASNRWTRVAAVDIGQMRRLYPILGALEPLALRLSWERITAADLAVMQATNEELRQALLDDNRAAASHADVAFHQVIIDRAENEELAQIIAAIKVKLRRAETSFFGCSVAAVSSVEEHAKIIVGMQRGDLAAAGAALEQNWSASLQRFLDLLEGETEQHSAPYSSEQSG